MSFIHKHLYSIKQYDRYTYLHSCRVAESSEYIGRCLDLCEKEIKELNIASNLHDLGKIKISKDILCKPGKLSEIEWQEVKQHPANAISILENCCNLTPACLSGIYTHHERYDGKGYPLGLKGEDIPLYGRIISIADAIDAMISYRSYRQPVDVAVALRQIKECAGTQFDPAIVQIIESNNYRNIFRGFRFIDPTALA